MLNAAFHSPANRSLGCSQVAPLFHPHSCNRFVSEFFEKRHHLTAGMRVDQPLLSSHELPALAERWHFKVGEDHSQARILLPNSFSHDGTYEVGSRLDASAMHRAHRHNSTVVMHNFELYHTPIALLSLALMRTFGVYAQANVYFSPPGLEAAVHAHQDAQSVFIIQCEGRKRWQLFDPPQRWRLRYNQRGKAGDVAPPVELQAPVADVTLEPGDILFLPRGMYHRTSTLTSDPRTRPGAVREPASLHVTVGVETDTDGWTWLALLKDASTALELPEAAELLDTAQWNDERLRSALPLSLCRPGGSFDSAEPHSAKWFADARALLTQHLNVRPEASSLRKALDGALRTRQEYVEKKRQQVMDFMALSRT